MLFSLLHFTRNCSNKKWHHQFRHYGILDKHLCKNLFEKIECVFFCGDSNMEEEDKILTMKATGFKSLRINCWNITRAIWISNMVAH